MAVDLALMRSSYARIQLYERLHGAVLEAERFLLRTKDLQNLTKEGSQQGILRTVCHPPLMPTTPHARSHAPTMIADLRLSSDQRAQVSLPLNLI